MEIAVLAKLVPNPSGDPPEIAEDGFRLRRDQPEATLDPSDEPGIETAVRLVEELGGRATVFSVGPEPALEALWRALAIGVDDAVLVSDDALAGADALATAKVLAAAIGRRRYDLVLAGTESSDGATGTLPSTLAQLLDLPCASFARHVEVTEGHVRIERQTSAGYDVVECALPALVTTTAAAATARYVPFRQLHRAKEKPVERLSLAQLGLGADDVCPTHEVEAIEVAPEREPGEVVAGAAQGTARILQLLREAEVV
jgi:electron transfer flavoprotein beta subunit